MSVHMRVVDLDNRFLSLSNEPVIVNTIDTTTLEGKETLNRLLYTKYEGDALQIVQSCDCGALTGGHEVGNICAICKYTCENSVERKLESVAWMRTPGGVTAFINPGVYNVLRPAMREGQFDVLRWLIDPFYQPMGKVPPKIRKFEAIEGFTRGINYFHANFDTIMAVYWENGGRVLPQKRQDTVDYIIQNRTRIFCQYLPMPSKLSFVIEKNDSGTYADKTMALAIDAMRTICGMESAIRPLPIPRREARVAKGIAMLAEFHMTYAKLLLTGKPRLFRKHVFGGRVHFSGRAVITSISENHFYDEIHVPWALALQILKVHITNKLFRRGYNPAQISRMFIIYAVKYHPVLDEIFQELIRESPHERGLPVCLQRNLVTSPLAA